jgi:hypothetical protein
MQMDRRRLHRCHCDVVVTLLTKPSHTTDHPWYLNESPMVLCRHVLQNILLILSLWLVECLILSPPGVLCALGTGEPMESHFIPINLV